MFFEILVLSTSRVGYFSVSDSVMAYIGVLDFSFPKTAFQCEAPHPDGLQASLHAVHR